MYGYVPTRVRRFDVGPCARARPKSATLMHPLSSKSKFPDLTSRWMMLLECRYTIPRAVSAIHRKTCAAVMFCLRLCNTPYKEPLEQKSITRHRSGPVVHAPRNCTTCLCRKPHKTLSSRRKSSAACGCDGSNLSRFTATSVPW
eukprot:30612-Pelagococcus_subviridis.AAC.33